MALVAGGKLLEGREASAAEGAGIATLDLVSTIWETWPGDRTQD